MKKAFLSLAAVVLAQSASSFAADDSIRTINVVKADIFEMAESFKGQGDTDFSRQKQLEPLVQELLALSPQGTVPQRLKLLVGPWKQIFGPYGFTADRRANRMLDADNIYQIIYEGGYYYNVARNKFLGIETTALFRGNYGVINDTTLSAQFNKTSLILGSKKSPQDFIALAPLSEAGTLKGEIMFPRFLSGNIMAQKGTLREVYTDADMRIMYGSTENAVLKDYIYIMRRVPETN
jgi:hypothetical protein